MTKTAIGHNARTAKPEWHVIDAKGQILGRLASRIAMMLMGKHKPNFTRNVMTGDQIVVVNAAEIKVTGAKMKDKIYKRYSGYQGGLKETPLERVMTKKPTFPLQHAIQGMLPKSSLGNRMLKRVYVYAGADHPHAAQQVKEQKASS